MKKSCVPLALICFLCTVPLAAADDDFKVTYHVERTSSKLMSLDQCTDLIERLAKEAGYRVDVSRYPGQLGVISGGSAGSGSFLSHCISVDDKTVSVIQGLDYGPQKGPVGEFADRTHQALIAATVK
jgi:hypothetical protein